MHVKRRYRARRPCWGPDLVRVGEGRLVLLERANFPREQRSALLFGGSTSVEICVPAHSRAGGPQLFRIHTPCCPSAFFNSKNRRREGPPQAATSTSTGFLTAVAYAARWTRLSAGLRVRLRAERFVTSFRQSRDVRDASASIST